MDNEEKCLVQKYQFPHLSEEVERNNIEYNVLFWNNQLFGSVNKTMPLPGPSRGHNQYLLTLKFKEREEINLTLPPPCFKLM